MIAPGVGGLLVWLLMIGVFTAIVIVSLMVRRQQDATRDAAYQAYCAQRGYQYVAARPGAQAQYAAMLGFFKVGSEGLWNCEVSGSVNGREFTAFEFSVRAGGRSPKVFPYALMRWLRPDGGLPDFFLRPIDEFNRGEHEDATRVEFVDDSLFTFAYALESSDIDAARAFFDTQRRAALRPILQADPQQYVRGAGSVLFWYHTEYLPPAEAMDSFIAAGDRLAASLLG